MSAPTKAIVAAKTRETIKVGRPRIAERGQMVVKAPKRPIHLPKAPSDDVPRA